MTTAGAWLAAHPDLDRLDRELLLGRAAGLSRAQLLARPERPLDNVVLVRLGEWAARRRSGEPLAYIFGEREFWGLTLEVGPDVLVPRPETELLVELALTLVPPSPRLLDLGTGSGALAIALARALPAATVTASDVSPAALDTARRNARRHGTAVTWLCGDWFAPVAGRFDLIVSNPPYVAEADPHLKALRYEPAGALVAGPDGLDAIRRIVAGAGDHLETDGILAIEHGHDQAAAVRRLLDAAGFIDITTHRDLAGLDRVTRGRQAGATT